MNERNLASATSPSSTPSHLLLRNAATVHVEGTAVQNLLYTFYNFTASQESTLDTYHKSGISQDVANTQCAWCFMATGSIDK